MPGYLAASAKTAGAAARSTYEIKGGINTFGIGKTTDRAFHFFSVFHRSEYFKLGSAFLATI
jgi:hypothetical protein